MSNQMHQWPIGRRTVLKTSGLALGAFATLPTVSGSNTDSSSLSNTILIEGTGSVAGYQVTVSDAIVTNDEIASVNDQTTITGMTATGMVGPGDDAFDYDGEITEFFLSGDATISVDGDEVDVDALGSDGDDGPPGAASLSDQETDGTSVTVEHVEMSVGGYLSIHDVRRRLYHDDIEENGIGSQEAISDSFIGLTVFLQPGTHHDVEVPLFDHSSWDLPGDPPAGDDADGLEESQPVLAIPHVPTDPPEFQLGDDGAYAAGPRTLDDLPVIHDIGTVYVEGNSSDTRVAAKREEVQAREDFDG